MARFEVGLLWEIEEGVDVFLSVRGNCIHEPAVRRGNPDRWTEGIFALEDIEVRDRHDTRLPVEVETKLKDSDMFMRAIEERVR